jgi:hypothetical protein
MMIVMMMMMRRRRRRRIMHCGNNFSGKYWATAGPKFSPPHGDPD